MNWNPGNDSKYSLGAAKLERAAQKKLLQRCAEELPTIQKYPLVRQRQRIPPRRFTLQDQKHGCADGLNSPAAAVLDRVVAQGRAAGPEVEDRSGVRRPLQHTAADSLGSLTSVRDRSLNRFSVTSASACHSPDNSSPGASKR